MRNAFNVKRLLAKNPIAASMAVSVRPFRFIDCRDKKGVRRKPLSALDDPVECLFLAF